MSKICTPVKNSALESGGNSSALAGEPKKRLQSDIIFSLSKLPQKQATVDEGE